MNLNPRIGLSFNGQCEAAFQLYERCFGGKITFLLRWGDSPMAAQAPEGWKDKILHATLVIGETTLNGGDTLPDQYETPQGFSLLLGPDDPEETGRLFEALSEGGTVRMPLQETFWARRFGVVTDPFGISWTLNCEQPMK